MRLRRQDANGDMTFGQGGLNFAVNSREAVGQLVLTRLKLIAGEWFLDVSEGTPYSTEVLGNVSKAGADAAIRTRILGTQGVTGISAYSSSLAGRKLTVACSVDTLYGQVTLQTVLP